MRRNQILALRASAMVTRITAIGFGRSKLLWEGMAAGQPARDLKAFWVGGSNSPSADRLVVDPIGKERAA
jgi:hypothetical protein